MKCKPVFRVTVVLSFLTLLGGFAVSPNTEAQCPGVPFDHSLEQTRKAVILALSTLGFDLKKQEKFYLEGYRPRKDGYDFPSGGEIVGIWIKQVSQGRTKVLIETARSTCGYSGQKDWEDDILREMKRLRE